MVIVTRVRVDANNEGRDVSKGPTGQPVVPLRFLPSSFRLATEKKAKPKKSATTAAPVKKRSKNATKKAKKTPVKKKAKKRAKK